MMCHMAAFKQHCAIGFWKGAIMKDPVLRETAASEAAMGHLGRITSLKDLPSDKKLMAWIKEAMELNENGIKLPLKAISKEKKEIIVPDDFKKALAKNKAAGKKFEAFSYSHKKEYVQWITEAKTAATKNKRMLLAIAMIAAGQSRHSKYSSAT